MGAVTMAVWTWLSLYLLYVVFVESVVYVFHKTWESSLL